MILNKFNKRLIAARRPFAVVEIKNNPRITKVNGKQSAYNIVGKGGYGIAEFGCDELAATWFCEAANRYADEIHSRRSKTSRNCDVHTADELKAIFNSELVSELPIANEHEKNLVTITAMGVIDTLLAPAQEKEGGNDAD